MRGMYFKKFVWTNFPAKRFFHFLLQIQIFLRIVSYYSVKPMSLYFNKVKILLQTVSRDQRRYGTNSFVFLTFFFHMNIRFVSENKQKSSHTIPIRRKLSGSGSLVACRYFILRRLVV